jgi:hypothetical protein
MLAIGLLAAAQDSKSVITGEVRTLKGAPAPGVRVAAMSAEKQGELPSLYGVAVTDAAGRYRIEGIPKGRYYVIAGSLGAPLYHPDTSTPDGATIFTLTGAPVSGINFSADSARLGSPPEWNFSSPGGATTEGPSLVTEVQLGWRDRDGRLLATVGPVGLFGDYDTSADGGRIAVTGMNAGSTIEGGRAVAPSADIWILDGERGAIRPFTAGPGDNFNPIWSPDGKRIAFTSNRNGNADIFIKSVDGGEEVAFVNTPDYESAEGWSRDGRYILYVSGAGAQRNIFARPASGSGQAIRVVGGNFRADEPQPSFDGKWIAYTSDESGQFEIYIAAFPDGDRKTRVSFDGGGRPRWTTGGKELFFMTPTATVMKANLTYPENGARVAATAPSRLWYNGCTTSSPTMHRIGVTADGERFLLRVNCEDWRMAQTDQTQPRK